MFYFFKNKTRKLFTTSVVNSFLNSSKHLVITHRTHGMKYHLSSQQVDDTYWFQLVGFPRDQGGIVLSLHDPVSIFVPRQLLEFLGLFCKRRQSCTKRSQERTKFKTTGGYMAKTAVQYFPLKVCVLKVFNSLLFPCEGKHKQLVWKHSCIARLSS